jgi:hypothetical protein
MSPSRLPPPVWGLPDNSDGSDDGNVFNFLAGLALQNPTQGTAANRQQADAIPGPEDRRPTAGIRI